MVQEEQFEGPGFRAGAVRKGDGRSVGHDGGPEFDNPVVRLKVVNV
jgi:hypothetical protein